MGPVESEFDAEQFPPEYVAVGVDEPMPSILEKVEETWEITPNAILVIPRGAHAFHNTQDFLALGRLQGAREVRVSIASLDPIIAGLARLLGFYVVDPPPGHPALAGDPTLSLTGSDGDVEQPTAPLPLGTLDAAPGWIYSPSTPVYPQTGATTSTWLGTQGDTPIYLDGPRKPWPGLEPPPSMRQGTPPARTPQSETGQLPSSLFAEMVVPDESAPALPHVSRTPTGSIKARRALPDKAYQNGRGWRYGGHMRSAHWGRVLAVFLSLMIVALIGGSAYAYVYLPEGNVSVTPLNRSITNLPLEVVVITNAQVGQDTQAEGTPNTPQDISKPVQTAPTITSTLITASITEAGSGPAAGSRQVPRGRSVGTMHFTNRTGNPVTVPAEAAFKAANGVTVKTTQSGVVQATVFGQSFGTLDLPIAATVDGPDGNLAAGQLSGIYGSSLNYSNSALQGGTLETLKVVTQADIDGLVTELSTKVDSEAAGALLANLGAGQQLITQTVSIANRKFEPDHKANDDGEAVRVVLTGTAQAYVYQESEMHDSISQAVLDSVQTTFPPAAGPNLDLGSVTYDSPIVQSVAQGRVTYSTNANARVTFSLTPELAGQIRDLVKGENVDQARSLISSDYGTYVNPGTIQSKVLWFTLDKLPSDPARITVAPSNYASGAAP